MSVDVKPGVSDVIKQPQNYFTPWDVTAPYGMGAGGYLGGFGGLGSALTINIASAADTITPWGQNVMLRDQQLRAFWPAEEMFASALFDTIAKYVAFGWSIEGPARIVRRVQEVIEASERGLGWNAMMVKVLIDLLTQDNGGFIEVVRSADSPTAPVVSFNHLDSNRCIRTGRPEEPVYYIDLLGQGHRMKWYQVQPLSEFPSPVETARGVQYCALTRILRRAQINRDISVLTHEKAAGRFTRQVHLIGGINRQTILNAMKAHQDLADAKGLARYIEPLLVASLDPTARVTAEKIDLASIPDNYDPEKDQKLYITNLAMAFGADYQDFAPLPGGGLGSGNQSKVLNMKSRGKGPGLFMKMIERAFNFHGLMPRSCNFHFGDQDISEQMERIELAKEEAVVLETLKRAGLITTQVGQQILVDKGILDERYLIMMQEQNATEEITAPSSEPAPIIEEDDVIVGDSVEDEAKKRAENAAAAQPPRPENSNWRRNKAPSQNQKA